MSAKCKFCFRSHGRHLADCPATKMQDQVFSLARAINAIGGTDNQDDFARQLLSKLLHHKVEALADLHQPKKEAM